VGIGERLWWAPEDERKIKMRKKNKKCKEEIKKKIKEINKKEKEKRRVLWTFHHLVHRTHPGETVCQMFSGAFGISVAVSVVVLVELILW
jgi:hypothetical protein